MTWGAFFTWFGCISSACFILHCILVYRAYQRPPVDEVWVVRVGPTVPLDAEWLDDDLVGDEVRMLREWWALPVHEETS